MGKLKWATELAKKGASKVTDIQKGTKPKKRKSTVNATIAYENLKDKKRNLLKTKKEEKLSYGPLGKDGPILKKDKKFLKTKRTGTWSYLSDRAVNPGKYKKPKIIDRQYLKDK